MPTKPAPRPPVRVENDQNLKKWAIIGFTTVAVLVGGFFALNALMTEDRGGRNLVAGNPLPESKPVRKPLYEEAPVPLAARPIRLFEDYVKAIHKNDRKTLVAFSEFEEAKIDLLLTEERTKIVTESLQSKRWKMTQEQIDGANARMAAIFQNGRGFDIMELALVMRQRTGAEDWVVTKVEDRWAAASGKTPESRTVELGANRATAAAPIKAVNSFATIAEVDPEEQDWVPGTTDAQKAEVARHISDLFDDKHPAKLSAASQGLVNVGKNAIPPLLNEFMKLDVRKEDDVKRGNALDRTLNTMTGVEMGYDPASFQSTGALPPAQTRLRAVRRWFGWWKKHKDFPLPERTNTEDK